MHKVCAYINFDVFDSMMFYMIREFQRLQICNFWMHRTKDMDLLVWQEDFIQLGRIEDVGRWIKMRSDGPDRTIPLCLGEPIRVIRSRSDGWKRERGGNLTG
jgi:hypothetical protein